ncbi:3-dehydroquinate synthase [Porphyromonas sp.]
MIIGTQILARELPSLLEGRTRERVFIVVEEQVSELHPDLFALLPEVLPQAVIRTLQGGEACKTTESLGLLWTWLSEEGATRRSTLVLIGGGALLDLGGFAASTYMRGIETIYVPTTLLSMVDASVGGKTAIDFLGVKNLIGSFHPASEVIVDIDFLRTLPLEELLSGYGEVIKHATLMGGEAWREVCRIGDPVGLMDEEWQMLIEKSIAYKTAVVEADPKEQGLRRILNIGHTVGHALEAYAYQNEFRRTLPHGEAVVFGLIIESYITMRQIGGNKEYIRQLMTLARDLYSPFFFTCKDYPELLRLMRCDKKNAAGTITIMGVVAPGDIQPVELTDEAKIKEGFDFLRETFGS